MYIVFTVSQFHADVHSVYLVFLFDTTILSESMGMSNMFWWDLKSSENKEPFKCHSPYSLLICSISACSQRFVFCLFVLGFYGPVNSYGHVGQLPINTVPGQA